MIYVMCTLDKFIFTYNFCYCEKRTITKVSLYCTRHIKQQYSIEYDKSFYFIALVSTKQKKQNNYNRESDEKWTSPFLALDGRDASSHVQDSVKFSQADQINNTQNLILLKHLVNGNLEKITMVFWSELLMRMKMDVISVSTANLQERDTGKPFVNVLCKYQDNEEEQLFILKSVLLFDTPCVNNIIFYTVLFPLLFTVPVYYQSLYYASVFFLKIFNIICH